VSEFPPSPGWAGCPSPAARSAGRLGITPRALQRRLEEEDTSWRGEADALRREQAGRLAAEGLPRSTASMRLGYSDARSLRRAAGAGHTYGVVIFTITRGPPAMQLRPLTERVAMPLTLQQAQTVITGAR
jgi:hypothetical protein